MTEAELKAIEERADKATPGPWTTLPGTFWICDVGRNGSGVWSTAYPPEGEPFPFAPQHVDAEFLAASRTDVPRLCNTVTQLRSALRKIIDSDNRCMCEHDNENCCAKVNEYCPLCIAVTALKDGFTNADRSRNEK